MVIRLILLLLCLAVPAYGASPAFLGSGKKVGAAFSCSETTDYVGNATNEASAANGTLDRVYLQLHTPVCASGCTVGNFATAYIQHGNTDTDRVKVCIWLDDGDNAPDAGDALVGCTAAITGSAATEYSSALTGTATCGSKYWVGFIADTTEWSFKYEAANATTYYRDVAGAYAGPPADLTWSWTSTTRDNSVYVTVGP